MHHPQIACLSRRLRATSSARHTGGYGWFLLMPERTIFVAFTVGAQVDLTSDHLSSAGFLSIFACFGEHHRVREQDRCLWHPKRLFTVQSTKQGSKGCRPIDRTDCMPIYARSRLLPRLVSHVCVCVCMCSGSLGLRCCPRPPPDEASCLHSSPGASPRVQERNMAEHAAQGQLAPDMLIPPSRRVQSQSYAACHSGTIKGTKHGVLRTDCGPCTAGARLRQMGAPLLSRPGRAGQGSTGQART